MYELSHRKKAFSTGTFFHSMISSCLPVVSHSNWGEVFTFSEHSSQVVGAAFHSEVELRTEQEQSVRWPHISFRSFSVNWGR